MGLRTLLADATLVRPAEGYGGLAVSVLADVDGDGDLLVVDSW